MTRRVLTPLAKIVRRRSPRTGKREIWSAQSADGLWLIERVEDGSTTWELWSLPSMRLAMTAGTLRDAQAATASGEASRMLLLQREGRR